MELITKLVEKELTSLNFVRSKVAKAVQAKLAENNVAATRGIVSGIYNAIDKRYAELRGKREITITRSSLNYRINADCELNEVLTESGIVNRKFTLQEQCTVLVGLFNDKHKAFISKPTLGKRKQFHKLQTVLNSTCLELMGTNEPEDTEQAKTALAVASRLMESIRAVEMLAE